MFIFMSVYNDIIILCILAAKKKKTAVQPTKSYQIMTQGSGTVSAPESSKSMYVYVYMCVCVCVCDWR